MLGIGDHSTAADSATKTRPLRVVLLVLACVLVALCMLVTFAEKWLVNTWRQLAPDELVYHLTQSIEGTNPEMVTAALKNYALPAFLITLAVIVVIIVLRRHRRARRIFTCVALIAALASAGFALFDLERETSLLSYIRLAMAGSTDEDFIEQNYADPASVQITFPEHKRNVIYIYLESMELTYADRQSGGAFDKNVIPNLTAIAQENEDFSGADAALNGAHALPGTTWTIGGIFAQTSGLPLKVPFYHNSMSTQESFFPGVTALGDILAEQGYRQVFLLGSDASFGGRRIYFDEHGAFEIHDHPYAQQTGLVEPDYDNGFWGFEDEKLFEFAKQDLLELAAGDEPFDYMILTVDTHFEDGYVCRLCGDEFGDDQYANVFACSDRQVSEFVEWVQQQDFYEDTVIVLCGDHLTMDTDFTDNVPKSFDQRTYTAIINGAVEPDDPSRTRVYSTFDLFPTTLAAMGVTIEGDRLGLGTNLYSTTDTIMEEFGDAVTPLLSNPSDFLTELGGFYADDRTLEQLTQWVTLKVYPSETDTWFILSDVRLEEEYITEATLLLTDNETGEETRLPMELKHNSEHPDWFWFEIDAPYSETDLEHLTATVELSTDRADHYPMATYADGISSTDVREKRPLGARTMP